MYPSDLVTDTRNFYIQIEFVQYKRRSTFAQPFLNPIGGVTLPLPMKINDHHTVVWEGHIGDITTAAIENNFNPLLGAVGDLAVAGAGAYMDKILQAAEQRQGAMYLKQHLGHAGLNLMQAYGVTANPFLTMMFKSPTYKDHQLQWSFAPDNKQDADALYQISNYFKFNMLPSLNLAGTLLGYPNLAIVRLFPDAYLYKFKPCAVTHVDFDVSGGGLPSFHTDGSPSIINMTLHLKETEYWLQEDILNV